MTIQVPAKFRPLIEAAARFAGLPYDVSAAQLSLESKDFNPYYVYGPGTSPTGAQGIAQFEPGTWATWGKGGNPFDPSQAVPAYGRFMRSLLRSYHGNVRDALAAYNAGPGNIEAGYGYADTILARAGQGVDEGTAPLPKSDTSSGVGKVLTDIWHGLELSSPLYDVATGPSDVAKALLAVGAPFTKVAESIDWLFHPNHWVRIGSGVTGGFLVVMGIVQMSRTSIPGSVALPTGILYTGVGAVLLFVAFHNLPDSVTDFPGMLGYLSDQVHAGSS